MESGWPWRSVWAISLEPLELRVVLGHAALGVVAGGAGGDEELPVGGLEQHAARARPG